MSDDHYIFGEDADLDKVRTEMNFRKVIAKAKTIGNKSILRGKK
jgi:hypothetical protein